MTRKEQIQELKHNIMLVEAKAERILARASRMLSSNKVKWLELIHEYNLELSKCYVMQRKVEFLSANQGLYGNEIIGISVPKNRK